MGIGIEKSDKFQFIDMFLRDGHFETVVQLSKGNISNADMSDIPYPFSENTARSRARVEGLQETYTIRDGV